MTKKCEFIDNNGNRCNIFPSYGYNGKRTYCVAHKKNDMNSAIKRYKCPCGKQPIFGFSNDEKPTCCQNCKKDGMIDIKSYKCPCGTRPTFGFPDDEKATCCSKCKKDEMIDIRNKKCSCGKIPTFGFPDDEKATCCLNCKKDGMINIKNTRCRANEYDIPCPITGNRNYDGFCTHCFAHLFPSHPKTQNIRKKSKELQVVSYISSKYEGFLHDKPLYVDLNGGCCPSKCRIDLRKLINNTLLCIEIDEEQRSYHLKEDRYNNLFIDFSGKYIFIRYNPDKYTDKDGKRKNPFFNTRMDRLEEELRKHMERIEKGENKELVEIHYLYYNRK